MSELSAAILSGSVSDVMRLLQQGENVNARDEYGLTPLIQCAICENIELAKLLLTHGAEPNRRDIAGSTALFWAADNNHLELCSVLLKQGADPNLFTTDGQPILVNPRLRAQKELTELLVHYGADITFAKDYINAKLIGHRFELTGKTDIINAKGNFIAMDFEGFTPEFTLGIIRNRLITFSNSYLGKTFTEYTGTIDKIVDTLVDSLKMVKPRYKRQKPAHELTLEPVLAKPLLIIPVTYRGHAITFVKYMDLLARCDRGVNNFTDTIVIYKVNQPLLLNNQLLKKLIYENLTSSFMREELTELLALTPVITMPTKSQISGNCSWANVEAGVIAALFMIHFKRAVDTATKAAKLKNNVMKFYEAWVEWDKDCTLDDCINNLQNAGTIAQKASKAAMLGSILFQRCSNIIGREIVRASKILYILTKPEYKYILTSYVDVYCRPAAGAIGEKFRSLLLNCKLDLPTLTLASAVQEKVKESLSYQSNILIRLHKAAASGQLNIVEDLFAEFPDLEVDCLDDTGSTALIYAAWQGHFDIVRYLIESRGANSRLFNDKGGDAKKYAALGKHQHVVDYLSNL